MNPYEDFNATVAKVMAVINGPGDDARRYVAILERWAREERLPVDRWESEGGALLGRP